MKTGNKRPAPVAASDLPTLLFMHESKTSDAEEVARGLIGQAKGEITVRILVGERDCDPFSDA
jgi:hypothetical protein